MTLTDKLEKALSIVGKIYLGIAIVVGAIDLTSVMDSKRAMLHRCADRGGMVNTFLSGMIVPAAITGLTWPVSLSGPPSRPYDGDCR